MDTQFAIYVREYLDKGRQILQAIDAGDWEGVWHLLRQRDRLLMRWQRECPSGRGELRGTMAHQLQGKEVRQEIQKAVEIDRRCANLLKQRIRQVKEELSEVQKMRLWNRSRGTSMARSGRIVRCFG